MLRVHIAKENLSVLGQLKNHIKGFHKIVLIT